MAAGKTVERFFASVAPDVDATVADLLGRAAGPGPRASELVSLADFAALLIQAPGGEGLTRGQAERELLHALQSWGEWAGRPPSRLAVYCPWGSGYIQLDDDVKAFSWCAGESLRARELRWLWSRHIEGAQLSEIEASPGLGVRSLAVVREQALAAFGMRPQAATVAAQPSARRPVGVSVPGLPEPADLVREQQELKRQHGKGAVQRLADKYGCSRDTIERRLRKARTAGALGIGHFTKVAGSR